MKLRLGFVTNSSGACYIVGVKGDISVDKIIENMNVPRDSPMLSFTEQFAKALYDHIKEGEEVEKYTQENQDEIDDFEHPISTLGKKLLNKGMIMYYFDIENEDYFPVDALDEDELEEFFEEDFEAEFIRYALLYDTDVLVKTEELYIATSTIDMAYSDDEMLDF